MASFIAIHADCGDLRFLKPLQRSLASLVEGNLDWHYLNSIHSHAPARLALERAANGLVLILLHGRSDGFKGGDYCMAPEDDSQAMFMEKGEMGLLKGKAVFSLSCKGNVHAEEAIKSGARVFLGFDDVPFSRFDPVSQDEIPQPSLTGHCQQLILAAVEAGLHRLIIHGESFHDVGGYLKLWVRQTANDFVRKNQSEEHRTDVAQLFLKMAETIKVTGDGDLTWADLFPV